MKTMKKSVLKQPWWTPEGTSDNIDIELLSLKNHFLDNILGATKAKKKADYRYQVPIVRLK